MKRYISNANGFSLLRLIISLVFIGVMVIFFHKGYKIGTEYSMGDGNRVGTVASFEYKGFRWKTWEGKLILGGKGTVTTDLWAFSVNEENIELINSLSEALSNQKMVNLSYEKFFLMKPSRGLTTYFIQKVTEIEK